MKDNTLAAIGWFCCTSIAICAIAGIVYYNLEQPSPQEIQAEAVLELVREHGMNPMVFECMDRNWNMVSDYEICKIVAQNPKITKEDLERRLAD